MPSYFGIKYGHKAQPIGRPCKKCGKVHTKGSHRFHGKGSFRRTHKTYKGAKYR